METESFIDKMGVSSALGFGLGFPTGAYAGLFAYARIASTIIALKGRPSSSFLSVRSRYSASDNLTDIRLSVSLASGLSEVICPGVFTLSDFLTGCSLNSASAASY